MTATTLALSGNGTTTIGWNYEGSTDYTGLNSNDGATTRIYSPQVGDTVTYRLAASGLATGATISAVEVHTVTYKLDPVTATTQPVVKVGGTLYPSGVDVTPVSNTAYEDLSYSWTKNPATGTAWTVSDLAALEVGVKKTNSAGERVTQIYAVVQTADAPPAGTTWTAAGTDTVALTTTGSASSVSIAAGSDRVALAATGSASTTATGTGTAGVALAASGSASSVSVAGGTGGLAVTASGSAVAVSPANTTGTAGVAVTAAGSASSVSATSGVAGIRVAASGQAVAVLAASGATGVALAASGSPDGAAGAAGAAGVSITTSGAVQVVYAAAGAAGVAVRAGGSVTASASAAGVARFTVNAAGSAVTVTSATGSARVTITTGGGYTRDVRDVTVTVGSFTGNPLAVRLTASSLAASVAGNPLTAQGSF